MGQTMKTLTNANLLEDTEDLTPILPLKSNKILKCKNNECHKCKLLKEMHVRDKNKSSDFYVSEIFAKNWCTNQDWTY